MLPDRVLLKQNDTFAVSDARGDFPTGDAGGLGLYRRDCRFLSAYELRLNGHQPILLNNSVDRAYVATFQLVNPALELDGGPGIPQQTLSLRRSRFVHDGFHERIGIRNCSNRPVEVELELQFEADFEDIFEVRGYSRLPLLGERERPQVVDSGLRLGYQGLDGVRRVTDIVMDPAPHLHGGRATLPVRLGSQGIFVLLVDVFPLLDGEVASRSQFDLSLEGLERTYETWNRSCTHLASDNEALDTGLLWRNLEDLRVLCDDRPTGLFPTAGIPWYAVPFGRDALITSFQTLALNPDLARGSLRYLASRQGQQVDPYREEEPGKILHEVRFGELAQLHQIPHTPYFGTVDATPLFLVLLVELLDWTADLDLLEELWPHAEAALEWIDRYGDVDGDGFVEYRKHSHAGVRNQGWKDSIDSLIGADGERAALPAALVEVQGYVYHAKAGLARILRHAGRTALAERLETEATTLRHRFNEAFWMPEHHFLAQALDGQGAQVPWITSNPGHCLWSGIVDRRRAAHLVSRLLAPDMFSGWGIRTLSAQSPHFNPMSYHNGSVWPHDNSIVACGLRRYGHAEEAELVARSVLEACMRFADTRIPELFCGFKRDERFNSGPGEYLISCSPQAWGAGSLFHFLQTLLGVQADLLEGRLRIDPVDTPLFTRLRVEGLRVGGDTLDFTVSCGSGAPRVAVDRRPAAIRTLELPS